MRTVGAAARPGWLDAAEVAAANHRSSWISTPLPEQGGRPSQVCKSYADDRALTSRATLVLQMEMAPEQTAALIERAKPLGTRIILNLAPPAALPIHVLRMVDVLVVNETEAAWLAARLDCAVSAAGLHERLGGVTIALTLGREGADIAAADATWHQHARVVEAVDTTAAGDCFVGVLAHRLECGATLREAVERATVAAALCCTRRGSQGSLPTAAETDAFRHPESRG